MTLPEAVTTSGALDLLRRSRRVALICHASPDHDCIGGMMGMALALRALGHETHAVSPDPVPDYLLFVPGVGTALVAPSRLPEVDLIVTIEAASLERTEPIWTSARDQFSATPILNVDHHASNTGYGTERIFDPQAASVCEVLFRVLREVGAPIDESVGRCLLTGIIGDTRGFRTSGTTAETLRVAGELIATGASLAEVSDSVHRFRRAAEVAVWAEVLARARYEDGVLWTSVTADDAARRGLAIEQIDGIVEFLSDTRDISVAVVFKVTPGRVRVSMRSDGKVDLTTIAARWAGGGHPRAAGCTVRDQPAQDVERAVIAAVKAALASADRR